MARPILATPILMNKDAERLCKEMKKIPSFSEEKKAELKECTSLYHKFYGRLAKCRRASLRS